MFEFSFADSDRLINAPGEKSSPRPLDVSRVMRVSHSRGFLSASDTPHIRALIARVDVAIMLITLDVPAICTRA